MSEGTETLKTLYINMLGGFTLSYDEEILLRDEGKIHKVWNLLGYLVASRHRTLAAHELPELLCNDDRSNDPTKAVKNLVYRLRCMLSDNGFTEGNYILQKGGIYSWNNTMPCDIDIETFEEYYQLALQKSEKDQPDERLGLLLNAIEMYKGKFLSTFAYDEWIVGLQMYYHRMFTDAVKKAFEILSARDKYEPMVEICKNAIKMDAFDEEMYILYIKSLIALNRHKEALAAYNTIVNTLYDQMGVNPSKELSNLYREIIKTIKSVEWDLLSIKKDLNEEEEVHTCYFCEYEIFKNVYRFIARSVERTGDSIFIMVCTLTDNDNDIPETENLGKAMQWLKEVIGEALRKGDVFARYSCTQYVLMLPSVSYENGCMIGTRIEGAYRKNKISKMVKLHFKLQPLDPKVK